MTLNDRGTFRNAWVSPTRDGESAEERQAPGARL